MNQDIRTPGGSLAQAVLQRALTTAVGHIEAGRLEDAVAALQANGGAALKNPVGRNILGDIRLKQGRPRDAVRDFDAALKMAPSFPEAHANRGVALQEMGRLSEALVAEDKALSLRPDYATAHYNRGNVLHALRQYDDAVAAFGRAIRIQPQFAEAHLNRGNALVARGKLLDAPKDFQRALELRPGYLEALLGMADVRVRLRDFDVALALIAEALQIAPGDRRARLARASLFYRAGRYEESLTEVDGLLAEDPRDAGALRGRAHALVKLLRRDEAFATADAAVKIAPDDADNHVVLALTLGELGRWEERASTLAKAERLGASGVVFQLTRAFSLSDTGRYGEARAAYTRAIDLDENEASAHHFRSFIDLMAGDFAAAWPEHEWRLKRTEIVRQDVLKLAPLWKGEDLAGKKLLLHSEQGHGDVIQFVRFLHDLAGRGGRITLLVHEPLRRLFAANFPDVDVTDSLGLRSGYDYQLPLMSLAYVLERHSEAAFCERVPYLVADEQRVAKWRTRLGPEGFKIGISWQGNPTYPGDRERSFEVRRYAPVAALPGVRLISLQAQRGLDQLQRLPEGMRVESLGEEIVNNPDGFREMAAVMMAMDLLIVSDSAPAHLAGALGVPTWVALPRFTDWRWMLNRSDAPWYPRTWLFRQKRRGDWDGVFAEIVAALQPEVARRSSR